MTPILPPAQGRIEQVGVVLQALWVQLRVPAEGEDGGADFEVVALVVVGGPVVGGGIEVRSHGGDEPAALIGLRLDRRLAGAHPHVGDALAGLLLGFDLGVQVAVDAADHVDVDPVLLLELAGEVVELVESLARVDRDAAFLLGRGDDVLPVGAGRGSRGGGATRGRGGRRAIRRRRRGRCPGTGPRSSAPRCSHCCHCRRRPTPTPPPAHRPAAPPGAVVADRGVLSRRSPFCRHRGHGPDRLAVLRGPRPLTSHTARNLVLGGTQGHVTAGGLGTPQRRTGRL